MKREENERLGEVLQRDLLLFMVDARKIRLAYIGCEAPNWSAER